MARSRPIFVAAAALLVAAPAMHAGGAAAPLWFETDEDVRMIRAQLLYSSSVAQAVLSRTSDQRALQQRGEIERLQDALQRTRASLRTLEAGTRKDQAEIRRLSLEVTALAGRLAEAQERLLAYVAERDSVFGAALAHLRGEVDHVLETPEGREAVARILAGDPEAGAVLLDRLNAARAAARRAAGEQAMKVAEAADERSAAEILMGKLPTAQMIARYEAIVAKDPQVEWDWIRLADLYSTMGDHAHAVEAGRKALSLAANGVDRWNAISILVYAFQNSGREVEAVTVFEAEQRDLSEKGVIEAQELDRLHYRARLSLLGARLQQDRNPRQARVLAKKAVEDLRRLPLAGSPEEEDVTFEIQAMAIVLQNLGDRETGWLLTSEAVARARASLASKPSDHRRAVLASQLIAAAQLAGTQNRYAPGFAYADEAVALWRGLQTGNQISDIEFPNLATALVSRASLWSLFQARRGVSLHRSMGASPEALRDLEEAVAFLRPLQSRGPNYAGDLAEALAQLAQAYKEDWRYTQAKTAQDEALAIQRGLAEADKGNARRNDVAAIEVAAVERIKLSRSPSFGLGRTAPGEASGLCRPDHAAAPPVTASKPPAAAETDTVVIGEEVDEQELAAASSKLRAMAEREPDNLNVRAALASHLWQQGRDSRDYQQKFRIDPLTAEALVLARSLVAADAGDLEYRRLLANILSSISFGYETDGSWSEAAPYSREALRLLEDIAATSDTPSDLDDLGQTLDRAAGSRRNSGDLEGSAAYLGRALQIQQRLFALDPIETGLAYRNRLIFWINDAIDDGDYSRAISLITERVRVQEESAKAMEAAGLAEGASEVAALDRAEDLNSAATEYERARARKEAIAVAQRARALLQPILSSKNLGNEAQYAMLQALDLIVANYRELSDPGEAAKFLTEAVELRRGAVDPEVYDSNLVSRLSGGAYEMLAEGNSDAARPLVEEGIRRIEPSILACTPSDKALDELSGLYFLLAKVRADLKDLKGGEAARARVRTRGTPRRLTSHGGPVSRGEPGARPAQFGGCLPERSAARTGGTDPQGTRRPGPRRSGKPAPGLRRVLEPLQALRNEADPA